MLGTGNFLGAAKDDVEDDGCEDISDGKNPKPGILDGCKRSVAIEAVLEVTEALLTFAAASGIVGWGIAAQAV